MLSLANASRSGAARVEERKRAWPEVTSAGYTLE